jgi:tetratricopeptide (TPR) repeat protein
MSKPPHFSPAPAKRNSSDQALERAAFALQMQRPGEAERLAEGVLRANKSNTLAATILGRALLAQNRADEAVAPLERAARRDGSSMTETLLAIALAGAGRHDEALDQLRQTITRRPPFPPAFLELASQLAKQEKEDEAIAVLESGLALTPNVVELQMRLALLYLGRNDRARARAILEQTLAAAPGRQDVLAELARVMALDGDYGSAVETYRRALALRPDDALTRANLGVCLLEMGERDAGEASIRAAARGRPEMIGRAIMSLATTAHGRFFMRPSAATKFLSS